VPTAQNSNVQLSELALLGILLVITNWLVIVSSLAFVDIGSGWSVLVTKVLGTWQGLTSSSSVFW